MIIDARVEDFVTSAIGPFEVLGDHRKDSVRTGVIEVLSSDGDRYFVKIHSRLSRWNPEVYAYNNWVEPLGQHAPTLVASFNDNDVFGIIITPLQGRTVNEVRITDNDVLARIYYEAGGLLKSMQASHRGVYFGIPKADGSPYDGNPKTDPVAYLSDSIESWAKRAYDYELVDASYGPLIQWSLENCGMFKDDCPVPTNWDFSQNNWMVDGDGAFTGFIDFENMLWGLPLDSFAVIQERYTFDKPHLEASFYEGYGLERDETTRLKQKVLSVNSSLASIVYGHTGSNPHFHECGMRMLRAINLLRSAERKESEVRSQKSGVRIQND